MKQDITEADFPTQLANLSETDPSLAVNTYKAIRDFVANKYHIRNILPEAHYLEKTGREFDSRINWFRMRIYFDMGHPNKTLMFEENVPECYQQALSELTRHRLGRFIFPEGLEHLASTGEGIMPTRFHVPPAGHFFDEIPHKDDIPGLLDYLLPYKEKAETFLARAEQFQENPLSVIQFSSADCDLLSMAAENLNEEQAVSSEIRNAIRK